MERERENANINPYRLLSSSLKRTTDLTTQTTVISSSSSPPSTSTMPTSGSTGSLDSKTSLKLDRVGLDCKPEDLKRLVVAKVAASSEVIQASFAERYEGEIASQSKINQYAKLGAKYKSILLKEAKDLQIRFSKDMQEVNKMETTVNNISSMLTEFTRILQSQSDLVAEVHEAAQDATEHVQLTDDQLLLTLERSQSHSRNMVILTVGLGLLLLILDFVTP